MSEMLREILIDCSPAQTRVALTENGKPAELYLERTRRSGSVGDIYLEDDIPHIDMERPAS